MKTRIISAGIGIIILLIILFFVETPVLDVAVGIISAVAVFEMLKAAGLINKKLFCGVCIAFGVLFSSVFFNIFSAMTFLAEFIFAGIVLVFVLADHKDLIISEACYAFFVSTLVPRAFSILILFREYEEPVSLLLIMLSLSVAWFNDAAAYFTGKAFGKKKLCPEISPHKTVEGAIGGIAGCIIGCSALVFIFSKVNGLSVNWLDFVVFLPFGAAAGIIGDLCASIIKRQFNIKDYGNIIPGHGGIVDRFDSWMFVAPLMYIWNIYLPFILK